MVDLIRCEKRKQKAISEIIPLIPVLDGETNFSIVNEFIEEIKGSCTQRSVASSIIDFFRVYQRSTYQTLIEQAQTRNQVGIPALLDQLNSSVLLEMVEALKKKIENISKGSSDIVPGTDPDSLCFLRAFTAVLELVEMSEPSKPEREKCHLLSNDLLEKYQLSLNLKVAYHAELGKKILAQVCNNESTPHAFLHYCRKFATHVANFNQAYSEKSVTALTASENHFLAMCKEKIPDWHEILFSIEYCLKRYGKDFLHSFKYLLQWAELGHQKSKEVIYKLHIFNPIFLIGFIQALERYIDYHAGLDTESCFLAIFFLEKIGKENKEKNEGFFSSIKENISVFLTNFSPILRKNS